MQIDAEVRKHVSLKYERFLSEVAFSSFFMCLVQAQCHITY